MYLAAYNHFDPDVVLFVGNYLLSLDLCFLTDAFDKYFKRFHHIFGMTWRNSIHLYLYDFYYKFDKNNCFSISNYSLFLNESKVRIVHRSILRYIESELEIGIDPVILVNSEINSDIGSEHDLSDDLNIVVMLFIYLIINLNSENKLKF